MNFERKQTIDNYLAPKRVLIIYGPRRVGKTTMLNHWLAGQSKKRILSVVGDDIRVREVFASESLDELKRFAASYDIIAIDEAQQVPSVGLGMKMLVDAFADKQFFLTGSSSFELSGQVGEPLTGRHFTVVLLPLSQSEIQLGPFDLKGALDQFLIYGSYPETLLTDDPKEKERILHELVSSYLYKDILALERVKSPDLVRDIARMIAFQIGAEVSLNEIATALRADVKTVGRYLDVLEKMFVIKRVRGFSRNLRTEISKKARYYFLDNGVRNAVIGQFSPLSQRNDQGALWENFCFTELLKRDILAGDESTFYFWRTHQGQEIDIIRETRGAITAFECKWNPHARVRIPMVFTNAYPNVPFEVITPDNYPDVLME